MADTETAETTEQRTTDKGRAANDQQIAERNAMAAKGTRLPPVPGEGQPLEEQPGQSVPTDPAAFGRSDRHPPDRPMESRVAGGGFTTP